MKRCRRNSPIIWRVLICAFWTLGVMSGVLFSLKSYNAGAIFGRLLPAVSPSIPVLVMIRFGMLLFSILLLRYCRYIFLLLILSVSFSYGILVSLIFSLFGSAAWLVWLLLLTPDIVLLTLFLFYSISCFTTQFSTVRRDIVISFLLICSVSIAECCYIAPFTSALF